MCRKANHFTTSSVASSTPGSITRGFVVDTTHLTAVEHPSSTDQRENCLRGLKSLIGKSAAVVSISLGRLFLVPRKSSTSPSQSRRRSRRPRDSSLNRKRYQWHHHHHRHRFAATTRRNQLRVDLTGRAAIFTRRENLAVVSDSHI